MSNSSDHPTATTDDPGVAELNGRGSAGRTSGSATDLPPPPSVPLSNVAAMLFPPSLLSLGSDKKQGVPPAQADDAAPAGTTTEYKDLLTTIAELRTDLHGTVSFASRLGAENASLRRGRDEAAATSARARKRHADVRSGLLVRLEAAAEREREADEEAERRRDELEERTRDVRAREDELRRCFRGTDGARALRAEIEAEMEAAHAGVVTELKKEVNKWRDDCLDVRRELEMCRAECEEIRVSSSDDIEAADRIRREEVLGLQQILEKHFSGVEPAGQAETVRDLEQSIEEMGAVEKNLRAMLEETREDRDKQEMARQEAAALHEGELADALDRFNAAEVQKQALQQKVERLESERDEAVKRARQQEAALADAENEVRCIRKVLVEEQSKLVQAIDSGRSEVSNAQMLHEEERDELIKKNEQLRAKLENTEGRLREAQGAMLEKARSASASEAAQKEERLRSRNEMERKIQSLQRELSRLEEEHQYEATKHAAAVHRLKHACESCRFDSNLAAREKEAMAKTVVSAQNTIEQLKKDLVEAKKASDEAKKEASEVAKARGILQEKNIDLDKQTQQLRSNLDSALQQLGQLKRELASRVKQHSVEINDLKSRLESEMLETRKNLESEAKKLQKQLSKEQRRSFAYKEKALEAHQKAVLAKEAITCLTMNTETGES